MDARIAAARKKLGSQAVILGHHYQRDEVIRFATSGDIAAFIAEPVMGEGGILVPPKNYFREVKMILDQHGILFIADEVQSGFGRTERVFFIKSR